MTCSRIGRPSRVYRGHRAAATKGANSRARRAPPAGYGIRGQRQVAKAQGGSSTFSHGLIGKLERAADVLRARLRARLPWYGEADRLKAQALFEDALHVLTIVLVLFYALAVRVDVRVADDAYHGAVLGRVDAKAPVQARDDHVFEQDIAIPTPGSARESVHVCGGGEMGISMRPMRPFLAHARPAR